MAEVFAMKTIRIWFKKVDTAKYISHLDLCRCISRAIHKAKLPFWYTEGFNPHVFFTVAMPISLGYEGIRESMDVKLLEEDFSFSEIIEKLNKGLPLDIRVFDVTEPTMKPSDIRFSSYKIETDLDIREMAKEMLMEENIFVSKKSKKGMKQVDIKEHFVDMDIRENGENSNVIQITLPSSNDGGINPRLFFEALKEKYSVEFYFKVTRTNCFDKDMKEFD